MSLMRCTVNSTLDAAMWVTVAMLPFRPMEAVASKTTMSPLRRGSLLVERMVLLVTALGGGDGVVGNFRRLRRRCCFCRQCF